MLKQPNLVYGELMSHYTILMQIISYSIHYNDGNRVTWSWRSVIGMIYGNAVDSSSRAVFTIRPIVPHVPIKVTVS